MLTELQRKKRPEYVGSSDSAAILGESPWRGRIEVYHEKTEPLLDDKPTAAMKTGNLLEVTLLEYAARMVGVQVTQANRFRVSHGADGGILSCNLDGWFKGRPENIEAKYVGPTQAGNWGEDGTDQVPNDVFIQCQHQMFVCDFERTWVPVLLSGDYQLEWRLYCVERCDPLIVLIVKLDVAFWYNHVVPRIPPPGGELPPLDILKARKRVPQSSIEVDENLMHYWRVSKERLSEATAIPVYERDEAYRRVVNALGDAEAGTVNGQQVVTYLEQNGAGKFDKLAMRRDGVLEKYWKPGTCRVLKDQKHKLT